MKLASLTMFGVGYVLGSRAGRERYEQIRLLARKAAEGVSQPATKDRVRAYAERLETYSRPVELGTRSENGSRGTVTRVASRGA